jgi:5-methylcytosine-specific restriction enzyme A
MEDFNNRASRQSFYTTQEWKNLREYVLSKEPFCRECSKNGRLKAATIVDHIIDIADAPELRLIETNLQPLCETCHNRKTMRKTMKGNVPQSKKVVKVGIYKKKWRIDELN